MPVWTTDVTQTDAAVQVSYRFFLLSFFGFCRAGGGGPLAFFICSVVLPSLDSVSSCSAHTGSNDHPVISQVL